MSLSKLETRSKVDSERANSQGVAVEPDQVGELIAKIDALGAKVDGLGLKIDALQPADGQALLLTIQQAAEVLNCEEDVVLALIAEGLLPRIALTPDIVRVPRAEVHALVRDLAEDW